MSDNAHSPRNGVENGGGTELSYDISMLSTVHEKPKEFASSFNGVVSFVEGLSDDTAHLLATRGISYTASSCGLLSNMDSLKMTPIQRRLEDTTSYRYDDDIFDFDELGATATATATVPAAENESESNQQAVEFLAPLTRCPPRLFQSHVFSEMMKESPATSLSVQFSARSPEPDPQRQSLNNEALSSPPSGFEVTSQIAEGRPMAAEIFRKHSVEKQSGSVHVVGPEVTPSILWFDDDDDDGNEPGHESLGTLRSTSSTPWPTTGTVDAVRPPFVQQKLSVTDSRPQKIKSFHIAVSSATAVVAAKSLYTPLMPSVQFDDDELIDFDLEDLNKSIDLDLNQSITWNRSLDFDLEPAVHSKKKSIPPCLELSASNFSGSSFFCESCD